MLRVPRIVRRTLLLVISLVPPAAVPACSGGSGGDATITYRIGGDTYVVDDAELVVSPLPEGRRFLMLRSDELGAEPNAIFIWRMPLGDPGELAGRELDLSPAAHEAEEAGPPNLVFELGDDVSAVVVFDSSFRLRIASVENGFVEGSFTGTGLDVARMNDGVGRREDVSGTFRARLVVEDA